MLSLRTYPAVLAITGLVATFAFSNVLTALWPSVVWLPRIGGVLVGISVFMQGYVSVNRDNFDVPWRWGLTREQVYLHCANFFAVFGTFMWAFGDLLPPVPWLPRVGA
jgi:hypothetical protein